MLASAWPAYAEVVDRVAPPVRKLSRGLANTITGVFEIPLTIQAVGLEQGPAAGLSLGLMIGLGGAVTRTAIGLIEVATFPFPLPRGGYEPLLQPEFLFQPEIAGTSAALPAAGAWEMSASGGGGR